MRAIIKKIRSPRGASITFALMLFLICALVSGVAIVAATVAGGRMSSVAETDQRYYAVNSATEMFKSLLDDKVSTVTVEKRTQKTIIYYDNPNADDERTVDSTPSTSINVAKTVQGPYMQNPETRTATDDVAVTFDGNQLSSIERDILGKAAYYLTNDAPAGYKNAYTLEMYVPTGETLDERDKSVQSIIQIDVYERVTAEADGEIYLYVSKKQGGAGLAYTLELKFVPDKQEVKDKNVEYGAPVKTGGFKEVSVALGDGTTRIVKCPLYSVMETTIETTTTTYTWELIGITKNPVPDDLLTPGGGGT